MRTRAYKENVAFATALGARVRKRTLCSFIGNTVLHCHVKTLRVSMKTVSKENYNKKGD